MGGRGSETTRRTRTVIDAAVFALLALSTLALELVGAELQTWDVALVLFSDGQHPEWLEGQRYWSSSPHKVTLVGVMTSHSPAPANQTATNEAAAELWVTPPILPKPLSLAQQVALAPFLAARALPSLPAWIFFALDSTIVNLAGGLMTMLRSGWDAELPYVVSDCLVSPTHNGSSDHAGAVQQICDMAAPHCLPCHASNPAYWLELASAGNAASRAALLSRLATPGGAAGLAGCPCTPALACAAAAQVASAGGEGHRTALLRCMEGATHRHFIAPAGGVALSRGLLQRMGRLELPQLAEVLGGLASAVHNMNAAEAGFELLSRLLWDAGHAVTRTMDLDPATHWWHPTSRFGRLPTAAPPPPSQGALPAGGAPLGQGPAAAGRLADDRTLSSAAAEVLRSACLPPLCTRDFLRMVSSSLAREQQGPSRALYDSITSAVALAARLHNTSSSFPIQPGITAATTSNALNASSTNASNPTTTACDQQAAATGGATQRRPFYTVETCLSNYPGKACPVIEACVKDTTCVMPGSGSFNWAVEEEEAFYSYMNFIPRPPPGFQKKVEFQSTSLLLTLQLAPRPYGPPNRTSCLNPDAPASWFSGQWHRNTTFLTNGTASANGTHNSTLTNNTSGAVNGTQAEDAGEDCVFHRLPRRRIVELLSGKKVFFTGDSLNRQLYHRLIWYLRGMEAVMEHYYHEQAVYVYYWNDTDSFKIGPDLLSNYSAPLAPHERFKLFYWYEDGQGRTSLWFYIHPTYNYSLVADAKPDIMVVGSIAQFYYGKQMGNLTRLHVDTLLRNISSLGGPKHYFWLMFQDGELAHSPWISQSAIEFGQRARALHARLQPEVKNINFQILPYDTMSGVPTPWRRNEQEKETWRTFGAQGLHFQCSVYPPYPEPITGFKAPPTLDCTDGMDLELNFLWLNSALRWAELNPGQW